MSNNEISPYSTRNKEFGIYLISNLNNEDSPTLHNEEKRKSQIKPEVANSGYYR